MQRIKLKNWNATTKKRLFFTVLFSLILTLMVSSTLINNLSKELPTYISSRVKKENLMILKEAFMEVNVYSISVDDIIKVVKNSKEEIVQVDFDMQTSSSLLTNITSYLNDNLGKYNYLGYRIDIPVGILTNNPIFVNVGPKIPVKIELSDVALGNVRTSVKPFGINNALIEVYLDIFIRSQIIYPFAVIDAESEYSSLIASKIITGTVPSLFGGSINSKSETINLPLN